MKKQKKIDYGVPQGYVLRPRLFNMYSDIFSLSGNENIIGFAGNTAIFYKADNW